MGKLCFEEAVISDGNQVTLTHTEFKALVCLSIKPGWVYSRQQIIDSISKMKNIKYFLFNISREKGIPGHINIKNDDEWVDIFHSIGLKFDKEFTKNVRTKYKNIKPDLSELWQKNIFVFKTSLIIFLQHPKAPKVNLLYLYF